MWLDNYYIYSWLQAIEPSYYLANGLTNVGSQNVPLPKYMYTVEGVADNIATVYRYDNSHCVNPLSPPANVVTASTSYWTGSSYMPNLVVGTGSTPVTPSDYKLEAEVYENLTCSAVTTLRDANAGTITHTKTMQYAGAEPLAVSEIGLAVSVAGIGCVLLYREVLEEPITVNNGETFSVAIKHQLPVISWN